MQLPLSKYDATFKRQRRYIQQTLGPRSIPAYHSTLRNETQLFLQAIVNNPPDYLSHIRKYAGGLTLSVVYGYQVTSSDDKFLAIAEECLLILANEIAAGSGIWAVDIFPQLKYVPSWFPGGGFKSKAARWKLKMTAFVNEPFTHAKSATVRIFSPSSEMNSFFCSATERSFPLSWATSSVTEISTKH